MDRCLICLTVSIFVLLINCSLIPEEPSKAPTIIDEPKEATNDPVPDIELPMEPLATILSQSTSVVKSDGGFKFELDNGVTSILVYGELRDQDGTKHLALDGTYSFGNISFWFMAEHDAFKAIDLTGTSSHHIPPKAISSILG